MSNKNISMIVLVFSNVEECFKDHAGLQLPHAGFNENYGDENI
jgi:hypothetical protein